MSMEIAEVRLFFETVANSEKAVTMAQYLGNRFPMLGIPSPVLNQRIKEFRQSMQVPEGQELELFARELYQQPEREYHHIALRLLEKKAKRAPADRIHLYVDLIVLNSWWDSVDHLAKLIGIHFITHPDLKRKWNKRLLYSGHLWKQRVSLIFQLAYRERTDADLLMANIRYLLPETAFFIRKAIGWALRQHSRTAPEAVLTFVAQHENQLSGLSKREALRLILKAEKG